MMVQLTAKKKDRLLVLLIIAVAAVIWFPVFQSEYAYTDELIGLAQFGNRSSHSLMIYGRWLTEKLAEWIFGSATTIADLRYIRLFSFFGWIVSIPLWFYSIREVFKEEQLSRIVPFFATFYLVCTPPLAIYIGWAACFELFIANTAGLLAGFFFYQGLRLSPGKNKISGLFFLFSLLLGLISLFTYQNGFGCFLLPFLLQLIAKKQVSKKLLLGVAGYFMIALIYYLLFKLSLQLAGSIATERTTLHVNLLNKLVFFLSRPLNSAFHFTFLFNEKSIPGLLSYGLLLVIWLLLFLSQSKKWSPQNRIIFLLAIFFLLALIYLPSLIVQENYASNRTLLGLNMAVFLLFANLILVLLSNERQKAGMVFFCCLFFAINAWYNFNYQFLIPVKKEYSAVRGFIEKNYHSGIDTVYFIRPPEDLFVRKYRINRSWDEFGVPSTFFEWTPEALVRQIIFEKTRDRGISNHIIVKNWLGPEQFLNARIILTQNAMLVDTEKILFAE